MYWNRIYDLAFVDLSVMYIADSSFHLTDPVLSGFYAKHYGRDRHMLKIGCALISLMSDTDEITMRSDEFPVDLFLLQLDDCDVFQERHGQLLTRQVRIAFMYSMLSPPS